MEEDAAEAAEGDEMSKEYQKCIEEIQKENEAMGIKMGPLQMRNEAMRLLKQKRGVQLNRSQSSLSQGARRFSPPNIFTSFTGAMADVGARLQNELARELTRKGSGCGAAPGENNPSAEVMPGRRVSTWADDDIHAAAHAAAHAFQDIELSDSDEEGENSSPPQTSGQRTGENGGGLGGSSSRPEGCSTRRRSWMPKRMPKRLSRRLSSRRRSSTKSFSSEENEVIVKAAEEHEPISKEDEKGKSLSGSGHVPKDCAEHDAENGEGGEDHKDERPTTTRRRSRAIRTGRRRSSLFSVDERRASIKERRATQESGESSIQSDVYRRGTSLICSFGRSSLRSSFGSITADEDDDLICGWGEKRRSSVLSDSAASMDNLPEEECIGEEPTSMKYKPTSKKYIDIVEE